MNLYLDYAVLLWHELTDQRNSSKQFAFQWECLIQAGQQEYHCQHICPSGTSIPSTPPPGRRLKYYIYVSSVSASSPLQVQVNILLTTSHTDHPVSIIILYWSSGTIGRTVDLSDLWFAFRSLLSCVALAEPVALELNYCSEYEYLNIKLKDIVSIGYSVYIKWKMLTCWASANDVTM